jgi:hypothetical protein
LYLAMKLEEKNPTASYFFRTRTDQCKLRTYQHYCKNQIYLTVPLVVVIDVRVVVAVVAAVVELVEMVELGAVDEMVGVVAVVISTTIYSTNSEAHQ